MRTINNKLMSLTETARELGISDRSLYSWRKRGIMPDPIRIGRKCFYTPELVLQHLAKEGVVEWSVPEND